MNLSPQFAAFSSLLTSKRSHTYIHAHCTLHTVSQNTERNAIIWCSFSLPLLYIYYCGFKNLVVRQSSHWYTCAHSTSCIGVCFMFHVDMNCVFDFAIAFSNISGEISKYIDSLRFMSRQNTVRIVWMAWQASKCIDAVPFNSSFYLVWQFKFCMEWVFMRNFSPEI